MRLNALQNLLDKLGQALRTPRLARALFLHGVLAGAEHRKVLSRELKTVVDIGANRGQFSLAARRWAPQANVIAFEPLDAPAQIFRRVFADDAQVLLHQAAIGPVSARQAMHVSARDDSSSLLPISALQTSMFPGTQEVATASVPVAPLDEFLGAEDIRTPAMLKLDVQGFEYDALMGCASLLGHFDSIYCECSFVEFYGGQKLAQEVGNWLVENGFRYVGMFNIARDQRGQAVQADFLFRRKDVFHAAQEPLP